MNCRFLEPLKDARYLEEAWEWQFDKPRAWQELFAIWQESREEFLASAEKEEKLFIGVFERRRLIAVISLDAAPENCFEAHFDCPRGTPQEIVIESLERVAAHLFERGARAVYVFIARQNRPLKRICRAVGFCKTNVEIIYGQVRGAVVFWEQFVLTKINCQTSSASSIIKTTREIPG